MPSNGERPGTLPLTTIGVAGAGQMGAGIAQVAVAAGFTVILTDVAAEALQRGRASVEKGLDRLAAKERLTAEARKASLARLETSLHLEELTRAEVVVEAATENETVKTDLFAALDELCRPATILASNTSSIPIGRIARATRRPDKVIGMHFMNPVPRMQLVEIIPALTTSALTVDTIWELTRRLGKAPARAEDYPGFISNRILMPMINEAVFCLYQGVGSREDIDTVMTLGMNHPMGPLALADLIGLDTCLAIMETLCDGFKDSKYRPCPLLRKYVEAGRLGRKAGKGFYDYGK